ncbi:DUF262 domain-containing HNH endonuclease family protein [Mucilaginibacter sp.]|uniref:DUF262 domain-containing protein n=1 Tax=Mucilaginibacter sp. TaxID=1882438 RepID=UPI002842CBC9|nr:DUF262 domain-containing HNH endonuclease family protein [Mucilaginibacter sp.]MDR3693420.1 DUF262 domain-containing HNH endonuclease family protein [Mucilaginibacter sp.]
MINANKELLTSFFSNNLQYLVPFFQRSYVWDKENWDILWEHIDKIASQIESNPNSEHFIGTLITKQRLSEIIGESKLDLIDGQQRLTTFALLIKAIATKATGNEPYTRLKEKTNELVVFENAKGVKFLRIEHSRNDGEYFEAVMLDKDLSILANQEHKILKCYNYFLAKLENHTDEQLDNIKTIILNNVPIISMLLSKDDDEQEIFDTINSLGVKLTTGELLKNYIFSDSSIRPLFDTHWRPVFEEDEEQISFWDKGKTSGRVNRTNIEVLLYCYLIIQKKSAVELEKLFAEYKNWLKEKSTKDKIAFLEELKTYANIYYNFPEGTELNEIGFSQAEERFFHVIEKLEITTVYPLILYIYKKFPEKEIQVQFLGILESYLVRRNVCRLTTKNYNNLFIQIISRLDEAPELTLEIFKIVLSAFTEDTNKFPSDVEFRLAFSEETLSNPNAREILFCISLYQIFNPKNDIGKLSSSSYSVEHMMPQKWETNWSKPGMDDATKMLRYKKLKTLGNLTLVTKSLNSSMKNAAWEKKKKALKEFSLLKLTTDYIDIIEWDEIKIQSRSEDLASMALKIWK